MSDQQELNPKEMLKQVSERLQSLSATRAACQQMIENQQIKIVDATDESEDPLSITLSGQAAATVLSPLLQGVNANREQLINQKEALLNQLDPENSEQ
jgi:hypothetical protein